MSRQHVSNRKILVVYPGIRTKHLYHIEGDEWHRNAKVFFPKPGVLPRGAWSWKAGEIWVEKGHRDYINNILQGKVTPIWIRPVDSTLTTYTQKIHTEPSTISNDSQPTCLWCGSPTKEVALFTSVTNICTSCGR